MTDFDCDYGYGDWGNVAEVVHIEELNQDDQKEYVKKLWQEDPEKYFEWKAFCIRMDALPNLFGTADNPIPIDESKL